MESSCSQEATNIIEFISKTKLGGFCVCVCVVFSHSLERNPMARTITPAALQESESMNQVNQFIILAKPANTSTTVICARSNQNLPQRKI